MINDENSYVLAEGLKWPEIKKTVNGKELLLSIFTYKIVRNREKKLKASILRSKD